MVGRGREKSKYFLSRQTVATVCGEAGVAGLGEGESCPLNPGRVGRSHCLSETGEL